MANGTAAQRKTYGGSNHVRSIWQRVEEVTLNDVIADGYYNFVDIATASIGDLIEIDGPNYSVMREIIGQQDNNSWVTGPWGGDSSPTSLIQAVL